jgi:hypothetical protein
MLSDFRVSYKTIYGGRLYVESDSPTRSSEHIVPGTEAVEFERPSSSIPLGW